MPLGCCNRHQSPARNPGSEVVGACWPARRSRRSRRRHAGAQRSTSLLTMTASMKQLRSRAQKLRHALERQVEKVADITQWKVVDSVKVACCCPDCLHGLLVCILGVLSESASLRYLCSQFLIDDGNDLNIKGVRRRLEDDRERVPRRAIDLIEPPRLSVNGPRTIAVTYVGNLYSPPVATAQASCRVPRPHRHQSSPSSFSRSTQIPRAVCSLISLWRGMGTMVFPTRHRVVIAAVRKVVRLAYELRRRPDLLQEGGSIHRPPKSTPLAGDCLAT